MTEQQVVDHWIKQIDRILKKDTRFAMKQWSGGIEVLKGIRKTVEDTGKITRPQIQAIKNIKYGKN